MLQPVGQEVVGHGSSLEADLTGSWLVTGGSGALAGHVAAWLIEHGAERVLLASRSAVDPSTFCWFTSAPDSIRYKSIFTIQTPDAGDITSIWFVRAGAVTAGFNSDQRAMPLSYSWLRDTRIRQGRPPIFFDTSAGSAISG